VWVTSIFVELIDKTISVGLAFLVVRGISNRQLNQFANGSKLRDLKTQTRQEAEAESVIDAAEDAGVVADGYGSYDRDK
jgi:hypothetical protein